jgi:iron complex outermembrane receptor protein
MRVPNYRLAEGKRILYMVFVLLNLASTVSAQKITVESEFSFNIPPQSVSTALIEFSEQADLTLVFPEKLVFGKVTSALIGSYTQKDGIVVLLAGTGLTPEFSNNTLLSIRKSIKLTDGEKNMKNKIVFGLFLAIGAAFAIDTVAEERTTNTIEEVIVTAERREANLQKTPVTITAFSSDSIERSQLSDIRDLANFSPSLVFNQALAGSQISIRGVGQGNPITGSNPGVALHVDGVYLGHPYTNNAAFYEAERFEILRGPQGTLYGRNSTGGSINVVTKTPSFDPNLKMTLGYGDYDRSWLKMSGSNSLIEDKLAIRGSAVFDSRDGYVENKTTGQDVSDQDLKSYAVSALYLPSDDVQVLVKGDFQSNNRFDRPVSFVRSVPGSGMDVTAFGAQTSRDDASFVYNDKDRAREDTYWGLNGTVTADLGAIILKSITGYRDSEMDGVFGDNDGTDFSVVSIESDVSATEFSQEFTLAGSAVEDKIDWIAGVNYYDDDVKQDSGALLPFLGTVLPFTPPPVAGQHDDGTLLSVPAVVINYQEKLNSMGIFTQGTYRWSSDFRVTAGTRYTRDKRSKLQSIRSNITAPSAQCADNKDTKEWSKVTWKLGADLDVSENAMLYGSASTGFKAGGFNSGSCVDSYDEESLMAYEIGLKSQFLDDTLRLNGAMFYYDYTDMQVRSFQGTTLEIANAGESEITGVELDFVYQPSSKIKIDGGLALLDAVFSDAMLDDAMIPGVNEINVKGNKLERAPKTKFNLGVEYSAGDLGLRYEVTYSDAMYVDSFENDFSEIDSYTRQNVRLFWRPSSNKAIDMQLYVENLTDEQTIDYLVPTAFVGGVAGSYAPPRTWGILINWTPSL